MKLSDFTELRLNRLHRERSERFHRRLFFVLLVCAAVGVKLLSSQLGF